MLIKLCQLTDAWDSTKNRTGYTHYTNYGASRIDRIYMTTTVHTLKITTTTLAAAFTDHNAVKVQLRGKQIPTLWGKPAWKLNNTITERRH
jgi:endonuclease/exonuclease/phosphatase family metal-dependent hydrolase